MNAENYSNIHVAFEPTKLEALMREGKIHASDFSCLDKSSQKGVWSLIRSITITSLRLS